MSTMPIYAMERMTVDLQMACWSAICHMAPLRTSICPMRWCGMTFLTLAPCLKPTLILSFTNSHPNLELGWVLFAYFVCDANLFVWSQVRNILKYLFPVPKEDSKRIITFANDDDYISFRWVHWLCYISSISAISSISSASQKHTFKLLIYPHIYVLTKPQLSSLDGNMESEISFSDVR